MPLVLTQNEATESGHAYADILGIAYEYPEIYRRQITPGEPFIYYRGRRRVSGGRQPQAYLGVGLIGRIESSATPGRLICRIEDFTPFPSPVPHKLANEYLEPLGKIPPERAGLYFRRGVRRIDEQTFERILVAAAAEYTDVGLRIRAGGRSYATPETARTVDEIAIEISRARLSDEFPGCVITQMPHNNPGYDFAVRDLADGIVRYIEVKGTTRHFPHFYISEGERLFSYDHAAEYALLIVYAIDTFRRTGDVLVREGALDGEDVALRAVQWEGQLTRDLTVGRQAAP